jgi:serine/threonine protein kinase
MAVDAARVKSLFLAASDLADPAERAAYLDRECGPDAGLRARVEALLRANDASPLPQSGPADATSTHGRGDAAAVIAGPPRKDEQAGTVIAGKYVLGEMIGEGGMGSVWRAKQTEPVKRFVAVKLIKAGMDSKQVLARFEAERQALALMDHPNIAKVLDGGLHEGRPFFVMELVKGTPITAFCDARKLTPKERLELFVQACQAIQHAHQKGIIHRDVKPSNVLIALYDDRAVVKVIDFGVAKATGGALTERTIDTGFGGVVGTPQYMSPEQATFNNLDVDTRSDVYALGVLLYELLTGSPPFARKDLEKRGLLEILRVVREEEPPRPSDKLSTADALPTLSANRGTEPRKLTGLLRNELDWIVMKALEKDRARRYETANGFAADVLRYLGGEAVVAHPPSAAYRLEKFVRRHKGQVLAAGLLLLTLLAGVVGTSVGMVRAEGRRIEAERARASEADRAEGERLAKLDAQEKKTAAEAAAAAEKAAHEQARKRLAQIEKGNQIITAIFADLDVREVRKGTEPLEAVLAKRLVEAAGQLEGEAVGDPLVVAALQDRLGLSLLSLGHPQDAIPLLVKARETRAAKLGADHPDTLASMNNLAAGYRAAGKLDLAVPLFEETLKLMKAKLGANHPDTLKCMNNLATGYLYAGRPDLALPLLEETLKLMKAKRGADHPDTLLSMNNLAAGYRAAGKLELAVPLSEETLKLTKAKLGADHPDTLASMNNLAMGYLDAGKLDLALPLFEETLKLRKAKLGADHPDTLASMNNLAFARRLLDSEERYRREKAAKGPGHIDTLLALRDVAQMHLAAGAPDLAEPLLAEVLAGMADRAPDDAIRAFTVRLLAHCLALRQEAAPDAWQAFNTKSMLGGALLGQKKYAQAEPLLVAGYQGMKQREKTIPPVARSRLPEALDRLIELYTATDKPDEAKKWQAERAKYPDLLPPPLVEK